MSDTAASARILVVDDEPDLELLVRQRFRKKIREGEYDFMFAANGKEALDHVLTQAPLDVILCDINMPVMDGLTFLNKLTELEHVDFRAVIVSAYGDMENIRVAMNRGAFDFVTKPIDFSDLEVTIEKTLGHVRQLREARLAREQLTKLHRELEVAHHIQQAIIPRKFPAFPDRQEFDIYAEMRPAQHVGGDFYDFFLCGENQLGVAIGDVSGKGVPAALLMTASRALLKSLALRGLPPGECLSLLNAHLCSENISSMFVSLFYGVLDFSTGRFQYATAGHQLPFRIGRHSFSRMERTHGMVIGVFAAGEYETGEVTLESGDHLFLYTDGIDEAFNTGEEEYSDERLERLLRQPDHGGVQQLVKTVMEDVVLHANGRAQSDDMTILALEYRGGVPS
ncbi:MAG: SpoIIE family protein phosphatase [Bacteroidia bacterium]|nr:SpoIIE family protein phosphatase [Bacteroidia bacterium]